MHIVFLGARLPLTKTFVSENGVLQAAPYPLVTRVTSHHEQFNTLNDFKALLDKHAAKNHCLFNGHLNHPLQDESRAGKTLARPREWIVFDFDKVDAKDHVEVVAKYLPPECQQVSYVVQLSASMFRPDVQKWSGHIFMLLKDPMDAARLRQWFEYLNFNIPALSDNISLSDSMQALHWPLDRTVAHDSKLIYIAPPKCYGFTPSIDAHIQLVKKRQSHLAIQPFQPIDTYTIRQKINALRRDVGEDEIDYDVTTYDGHEILRKTGLCDVHDLKQSGNHYVRFNMNGGDSYAYFIDLRNPDVIRNFKGEPYLLTKDAAPELYKALRKAAPIAVARPALEEGSDVLAFYATNQNSKLRIGTYNPVTSELELHTSHETAARAWLFEFGLVQKAPFAHKYLVFDPTSEVQYIPGSSTINQFSPSIYMTRAKSAETSTSLSDLPPIINKVIRHVLGPCEEKVVEHFVNWLAFIFQKRNKTQTAWVLNGVEGTGKNTLVNFYLRPLLGNKHVSAVQYANLTNEFNGFLEQALLVVIEEADIRGVENAEGMMTKVKNWITDSPIMIRKMGIDHMELPNYSSFLLLTNTRTPANISAKDRRFNFGERQDVRWIPTPNERLAIEKGAELDAFADFLQRWPVDERAVTQLIDTQARADAHEATTSINQLLAEKVLAGDLQYFIDTMPSDLEASVDFSNGRFNTLGMYKAFIEEATRAAELGETQVVSEEQLFVLFRTLIPDTRFFQDNKVWRRRHFKGLGLDIDKQHRIPGAWNSKARGVKVQWTLPSAPLPKAENVTSITKRKRK